MKKEIISIFILMLLISATSIPLASSLTHTINQTEIELTHCKNNVYQEMLQEHELTVGFCDMFDTTPPAETTQPSQFLLDWIDANYDGTSGSKDCDEDPENQYWAHTFVFTEPYVCPGEQIESATLQITVRNDDDNDHLKIGCITCGDSWKHNNRLSQDGIPVGSGGTILLDLEDIPGLLDLMNLFRTLDIAVDDDSPVDCAKLIIRCTCTPNVELEKTVSDSQNGPWYETKNFQSGEELWFKIEVKNNGAEAEVFFVEDVLPNGLYYVDSIPQALEYPPSEDTVLWDGFHLYPYETREFKIKATVNCSISGSYENYAWVKYSSCDYPKLSDSDTANVNCLWMTPDLEVSGSLIWNDVTPGDSVTGNLEISNIGETESLLNWEVEEYPTWGTWSFNPENGSNLEPEEGPVQVEVEVEAPEEKDKEFTGDVKIINLDNPEDYEIIPVSLSTPKSKPHLTFLEERFPYLFNLFSSFL